MIEVNVTEAGVVRGTGLSQAVRQNNGLKCAELASDGHSLFFPAGDYELEVLPTLNNILWSSKNNVTVRGSGPSSKLYQFTDLSRLFSFSDCNNVQVHDLYIAGRNISLGAPELLSQNASSAQTCSVDIATSTTDVVANNHQQEINNIVSFTTAGTLFSPAQTAKRYFVVSRTTNTFKISETRGGAPITFTDNGTGVHTVYYTGVGSSVCLVFAQSCKRISYRNIWGEGCAGHVLSMTGCTDVDVSENRLWNNQEANNRDCADINLSSINSDPPVKNKLNRIVNNGCYSNSRVGISSSLYLAEHTVISGNEVIAMDATMDNEIEDNTCLRKEGITLQYYSNLPDVDNQEETTFAVTGNIIKNTRWSAIYIQTLSQGTNVGGIGSITGNLIENTCLDVTASDGFGLQGGISTHHVWQLTVVGNTIRKTNASYSSSANPTPAIKIKGVKDSSAVARSYVICNSNTIEDSAHNAIEIEGNGIKRVSVVGNQVTNFGKLALYTWGNADDREIIVTDNIFQTDIDPLDQSSTIGMSNGASTTENTIFCNNLIKATGARATPGAIISITTTVGTFSGNRIEGGSVNDIGMRFNTAFTERGSMKVSDNEFRNLLIGIQTVAGTSQPPLLHHNSTFHNVGTNINLADRIIAGYWNEDGRVTGFVDVDPSTLACTFQPGDKLTNLDPANNPVDAWYCITGGAPGTWATLASAQAPPAAEIYMSAAQVPPGNQMTLTTTPAIISVMDSTDVADRVNATPATALLGVTEPGRYTVGFEANVDSDAAKSEFFVDFTAQGTPTGLAFRGTTRDAGESTGITAQALFDVTQAELDANAGEIELQARMYGDAQTVTFNTCSFILYRLH